MLPSTESTRDPAPSARGRDVGGDQRPRIDLRRALLLVVVALALYASYQLFAPLAASIVLGAWSAHLSRGIFARASRMLKGRTRGASLLTGALVLVIVAPIAVSIATLVPAARSLLAELRGASGGRDLLTALVSGSGGAKGGAVDVVGLAKEYGTGASKAASVIATFSAEAAVGAFVFFATFFALLVDGERFYAWAESRTPIDPTILRRLTGAFHEAGRGLLVGTGLTALVQGVLAGAIYAALGVPRALLLGFLSVVAAMIPVTGPALVWAPVAAGLLMTGHPAKAAILAVLGVVVVGTVDNLLRPWLAKRARVGLSTTVVLITMFGGMAAFGAWGILLGPLVARLAVEVLEVARERALFRHAPPSRPSA